MTCTINTCQHDLIYNPTIHREKNISELHALTISAEPVLKRKIWNLRRPTAPERAILDSCHDKCIYPVINPFFSMTFGYRNSMSNCIPDLLHVFAAGVIKNLVTWILTIIKTISLSSDKRFTNNMGVLDNRIINFPYCPMLPHINWTKFTEGLSFLADNRTQGEKQNATGAGGGYRSSHFVTALFQLYFAIGHNGDVLPIDNNYTYSSRHVEDINLGNVTKAVLNAIVATLECYFLAKKTDGYTGLQSQQLGDSANMLTAHVLIVWDLKQKLLNSPKKYPGMLKLHLIQHLAESSAFWGSNSKGNTETCEHLHKYYSKGIWEKTSKRNVTIAYEMMNTLISMQFNYHMGVYIGIRTDGIDYFKPGKCIFPPEINETTIYSDIPNIATYRLYRNDVSEEMAICKNGDFATLDQYLKNSRIDAKKLYALLQSNLSDLEFDSIIRKKTKAKATPDQCTITLQQGIKFEGGTDTGLSNGFLYSSPRYGCRRNATPRYDFIEILVSDDNGLQSFEHAQILCILTVTYQETVTRYGIVQFLKLKENISPFPMYEWEYQFNGRSNVKQFTCPHLISCDSFAKPSCIIPCRFESVTNMVPRHTDRFWLGPRMFSDKSGWENMTK